MIDAAGQRRFAVPRAAQSAWWILPLFPLLKFVVQLGTVRGYGYFRDELYYLACADHLAWGYVDHPPFSIAILAVSRAVFGDSLLALRFLPALAGAATVWLTGWTCRRMGGNSWAQALSMASVLVAPVFLYTHHVFSMNAFEVLFWIASAALLAQIFTGGPPFLWLALGATLGLGLLNKISVLWLGFGLVIGLRFSIQRGWLMTKWPWLGGTLAFALFSPNIAWQVAREWPTLQFMRNATAHKMAAIGVVDFFREQLLLTNPGSAPVWIAGLLWLLFAKESRPFRAFAFIHLSVVAILLGLGSARPSYLAPAYPILFAAGGIALTRIATRKGLAWIPATAMALLMLIGVVIAPLALPVLSPESFAAYSARIGIAPRARERTALGAFPQHFADMFGWEDLAREVARVRASLPAEERERAGVFAQNYGEAGAIDFFGRPLGLPRAICGHNSYWEWGPPAVAPDPVIVIGGDEDDGRRSCTEFVKAGRTNCPYCMPYENDLPIWICRGLKTPLPELWPSFRRYI